MGTGGWMQAGVCARGLGSSVPIRPCLQPARRMGWDGNLGHLIEICLGFFFFLTIIILETMSARDSFNNYCLNPYVV